MGGDTVSVLSSTTINDDDDDDISTTTQTSTLYGEMDGEKESVIGETDDDDDESMTDYYRNLRFQKSTNDYHQQLTKSYDDLKDRVVNMEVAKTKVLSYTPGSWVENVGGMTVSDYNVPKTTAILLIGPKGSGKSSLINRISRVFEDDKFAPERAQVTYELSSRDGTSFLQEYMIPRNSTSFCFYDTPGFSDDLSENLEMIKQWMTKGVRHGELVKSASDSSSLRAKPKCKTGQDKLPTYERRRVGFVIFVVNGLSVLKYVEEGAEDTQNLNIVDEVFSSPILSFKDHKPVIAITHGDLLSISERARVRVYLGLIIGVHPVKQIFDIPDNCEPTTELTIVDLVRYALEHADRNLPCKSGPAISKGSTIQLWTRLLLLLVVGIFMFTAHLHGFRYLKLNPERVPEPSPEIKKAMKFDQESIPKPDLELKKVIKLDQEIVPEPDLEIKKATKLYQEIVPEADLEIKKVTGDQETVREPDLEIKKVTEVDQETVCEPDPEIKKVTEVDQETVREPDLEIKKVTEVDQETVCEPGLEIKQVKETEPGVVPEHILEMKKVTPGSVPKPSKKTKKGDAENTPGKNKKMKKVRVTEPVLEIDWKTIRHIW